MVLLTQVLFHIRSGTRKHLKTKFLDSVRIHVSGGSGGMGLPKYGGIGGDGGNIFVMGKDGLSLKDTLRHIKEKRVRAPNGDNSHKNCILGPKGEDVILEVPTGITVFAENGSKLGEINREDEKIIVAQGGSGGNKDSGFNGLKGQSHSIVLDLKLIADIGLVGFPNAGKSTLLSLISRAKPKIAAYPFTTIHPNIGIVQYPDMRILSIADLPGLIEGSHINFGMGHKFLKHIERTKVLLVVVDVSGFKLSHKYKSRSCIETIILLNRELELYREDLLDKPAILIINKMDKNNSSEIVKNLKLALADYKSVISDLPETLKPLKPFVFESTLCMTAKEAKEDEINLLKSTVREVLDLSEEIDPEQEVALLKQLDSKLAIRGPILA